MGNIFRDDKAPYAIIFLMGIVGWMFNAALDSAKDLRIIEVRTVAGMDGPANTVTFYIANKSMVAAINSGRFSFRCPVPAPGQGVAGASCLALMPSINANAQYLGSKGFGGLPVPIDSNTEGASVEALVPPKSEVGFRFGLASKDVTLGFSYVLNSDDLEGDKSSAQVRIITPETAQPSGWLGKLDRIALFVLGNYFTVLVAAMGLLGFLLAIYFAVSLVVALFGTREEKTDEKA
ncbi:hypothetical protein [Rhizobium leguminosarum]|uniref:hypothetical protein n=1 Tax=Rhizobium leguminosarum TaxID=384 RepID=UPI000FEC3323|nr:hypothetical protein [Rhizobium leguminosarum]RWX35214.1 hypothetical protein EHI43_11265 [Rhizobium leguminosarum]